MIIDVRLLKILFKIRAFKGNKNTASIAAWHLNCCDTLAKGKEYGG